MLHFYFFFNSYTGGNSNCSDEPDMLESFLSNWDINPPTPASITSSCSSASSASGGSAGVGSSAFTLNAIHSSISASSPTTAETVEVASAASASNIHRHYLEDDKSLVHTKTGSSAISCTDTITGKGTSSGTAKRSSLMVGGNKLSKGRQTVSNTNKKMAIARDSSSSSATATIKSEPGLGDGIQSSSTSTTQQSYGLNGSASSQRNQHPSATNGHLATCGANNKKSKNIRINASNSSATVISVPGSSNNSKVALLSTSTNTAKCRSSSVTAAAGHAHSSVINGAVNGVNGATGSGARNSRIIDTDITDEERRLLTKEGTLRLFYSQFFH